MALKLDVLANTRQVVTEMKKAGASVDDVTDALDDMTREGTQGGDKLEKSFRDLARDAQKAETAAKDVGTKGFKKASEGAQDFKDEANSSLRETAASITSVEDALGAVQEIAANAFVGFGPVGAGAGLVAALGFGLLLENLNKQAEAADEMKRRWADAYKEAAEEGRAFLSEQQVLAEANSIAFDPERAEEYKQALRDAKALNLDINDVLLARGGDEQALQTVIDATKQKYDEINSDFIRARSTEAQEIINITDLYTKLGDEQQKNADKAEESQDRRDGLHEREREQVEKTAEAARTRYEGLAELYGKGITLPVKVDESQLIAAQNRLAAWARSGVTVAVNGTLTGKGVWE